MKVGNLVLVAGWDRGEDGSRVLVWRIPGGGIARSRQQAEKLATAASPLCRFTANPVGDKLLMQAVSLLGLESRTAEDRHRHQQALNLAIRRGLIRDSRISK